MENTGKVAFLQAPREVEFREYALPEPAPGALLCEVEQANVCGSELHIWSGDHPLITDGVLGHEAVCRVAATGGVVSDSAGMELKEGDLVVPAYFATCGECRQCGQGRFGMCDQAYRYWSRHPDDWPHFHGVFATHYYIHPDQFVYKLPDGVEVGVAASANCALSQVLHGLRQVQVTADEVVVIQGAGGLGINAVAVVAERGGQSIVIDGVRDRLDRAKLFGADHVIDITEIDSVAGRVDRVHELTDGAGADVAVEVTGVTEAIDEGLRHLRKGGRYLMMGNIIPGKQANFDPGQAVRKSVSIQTTMRYPPWVLKEALEFITEHGDSYPFDELIDATYPLEDAQMALADSLSRDVGRACFHPHLTR
jgi:Zn-dependent alcohol dehydrogenases